MLKKLLRGHRAVRIGAALTGAAALAIGFASPALAAQNVNNGNAGNANAQNAIIVEGGAQASYQLMLAEATIFNQAPGCDLAGLSGAEQPLDYGGLGLNGEPWLEETPATTVQFPGVTVTAGAKKFILSGLTTGDNVQIGDGTPARHPTGLVTTPGVAVPTLLLGTHPHLPERTVRCCGFAARRSGRLGGQADLRRWRTIRRRSRSVVPPQMPSRSRWASACSRHACRTGQTAQMALASAASASSSVTG